MLRTEPILFCIGKSERVALLWRIYRHDDIFTIDKGIHYLVYILKKGTSRKVFSVLNIHGDFCSLQIVQQFTCALCTNLYLVQNLSKDGVSSSYNICVLFTKVLCCFMILGLPFFLPFLPPFLVGGGAIVYIIMH